MYVHVPPYYFCEQPSKRYSYAIQDKSVWESQMAVFHIMKLISERQENNI